MVLSYGHTADYTPLPIIKHLVRFVLLVARRPWQRAEGFGVNEEDGVSLLNRQEFLQLTAHFKLQKWTSCILLHFLVEKLQQKRT